MSQHKWLLFESHWTVIKVKQSLSINDFMDSLTTTKEMSVKSNAYWLPWQKDEHLPQAVKLLLFYILIYCPVQELISQSPAKWMCTLWFISYHSREIHIFFFQKRVHLDYIQICFGENSWHTLPIPMLFTCYIWHPPLFCSTPPLLKPHSLSVVYISSCKLLSC